MTDAEKINAMFTVVRYARDRAGDNWKHARDDSARATFAAIDEIFEQVLGIYFTPSQAEKEASGSSEPKEVELPCSTE